VSRVWEKPPVVIEVLDTAREVEISYASLSHSVDEFPHVCRERAVVPIFIEEAFDLAALEKLASEAPHVSVALFFGE
jgi:hypothetical protein